MPIFSAHNNWCATPEVIQLLDINLLKPHIYLFMIVCDKERRSIIKKHIMKVINWSKSRISFKVELAVEN